MIALSTLEICRAWASGLCRNRSFLAASGGTDWTLRIGAEMLRPPSEEDAPFLYLFPDSRSENAAGGNRELGALLGIVDGTWTADKVPELAGLTRLDDLERILRDALGLSIPMPVDLWNAEFEIINFPLLMLNITVSVQTVKTL